MIVLLNKNKEEKAACKNQCGSINRLEYVNYIVSLKQLGEKEGEK